MLHVKTCACGPGAEFPCPTRVKGCHETRKLLAHYRRCKDIRTREAHSGRRSLRQQKHKCFICSLVARRAQEMLGSGGGGSAGGNGRSPAKGRLGSGGCGSAGGNGRSPAKGRRGGVATIITDSSSPSSVTRIHVEKGFVEENPTQNSVLIRTTSLTRTASRVLMPPPPPRSPVTIVSSANDTSYLERNNSLSILLPHSYDSLRPLPEVRFPDLLSPIEVVVPSPRRQRAESCDERRSASSTAQNGSAFDFDSEPQQEQKQQQRPAMNRPVMHRQRSASCDSFVSLRGCDTIAEEGGLEHANSEGCIFAMDDVSADS